MTTHHKGADKAQYCDHIHIQQLRSSAGISPYQYLIQQRVERAKQLLRQTDRLITDIA